MGTGIRHSLLPDVAAMWSAASCSYSTLLATVHYFPLTVSQNKCFLKLKVFCHGSKIATNSPSVAFLVVS